jgi:hypothetical protein
MYVIINKDKMHTYGVWAHGMALGNGKLKLQSLQKWGSFSYVTELVLHSLPDNSTYICV